MKVVIVDLKGRYAAALTGQGEIRRIINNHYEIGQEIELYDIREVRQPRFAPRVIRRVIAAAAAIVILAAGGTATAYAIPAGTVSLSSDPSIEYTINCFDYVIGVTALNDDGEAVLDEIGESTLRHHKIEDAIDTTVKQMEKDGYPDAQYGSVEINVDMPDNDRSNKLKDALENRFNSDMEQAPEIVNESPSENQKPDEKQNNMQQNQPDTSGPQGDTQQDQSQTDAPQGDTQQGQSGTGAPQTDTQQGQKDNKSGWEDITPRQGNQSAADPAGDSWPDGSEQGDPVIR